MGCGASGPKPAADHSSQAKDNQSKTAAAPAVEAKAEVEVEKDNENVAAAEKESQKETEKAAAENAEKAAADEAEKEAAKKEAAEKEAAEKKAAEKKAEEDKAAAEKLAAEKAAAEKEAAEKAAAEKAAAEKAAAEKAAAEKAAAEKADVDEKANEEDKKNKEDPTGPKPVEKDVEWAKINEKLPFARDEKSKALRKQLFDKFDNGNGRLSYTEVEAGIRHVLELDKVLDCQLVVKRAYQVAKSKAKKSARTSDDFVERREFRYLLLCIRQYLEYWVMFDSMDTNDDERMGLREFRAATELLGKWGVTVDDPEKTFQEIDTSGGGKILFGEFTQWALTKSLDLEVEDD